MAQLGSLSVQGNIGQKAFFIFWTSTNQTWEAVEVKEARHWCIDKFDLMMLFLGQENDRLRNNIPPIRDSKIVLRVLLMLLGSQFVFQMCKEKEAG